MKPFAPPLFESAMLHEFACALERRGKALRNRGRFECSRAVEGSIERLNADWSGVRRVRVRLSIWSDGQLWLGVHQSGPRRTGGWGLRKTLRSHVAELDGREVCRRFEQTTHAPTEARSFWPAFSTSERAA